MSRNTEIQVSSDADYEHLIAEILIDKKTLFIVSKENEKFEIEILLSDKVFSSRIEVNEIIETLKMACDKLTFLR
jgi:hypothetical protein